MITYDAELYMDDSYFFNGEMLIYNDNAYDGEIDIIQQITGGEDRHEHYEGLYDVIPLCFEQQVLETNNKICDDDITVEAIPYAEVSNPYGYTVTIGG